MLAASSRARLVLAGAVALLVAGCGFRPRVPDAVISCTSDDDCPETLVCAPALSRCCRPGACGETPARSGGASGQGGRSGSGGAPGASDAGAATPDAEPATPAPSSPVAPVTDAGTSDAVGADAAPAAPISCGGTATVPDLGVGRQTFCTIAARAAEVTMSLHSMLPGDAISTRTYGSCTSSLPLLAEAADGTGAGRAVGAATIDQLADVLAQYQAICARHKGKLAGAFANHWARVASNQPAISERVHGVLGVPLDVLTTTEEQNQLYFGVTRHRRGHVVVLETTVGIDLLAIGHGASELQRTRLPITWADIDVLYLGNPENVTFEDARRGFRGRMVREMGGMLGGLRSDVASGKLEPGFIVGPATATVPMAVRGSLRDARGTWDTVATFEKKRDEAFVTPSPYGRIFGAAPLAPGEIDGFFGTIDETQWRQIRNEPLRAAYGGELFYVTVLLDVLADEVKASEFAFVYATSHLGYLFAKVLPPPPP